MRRLPYLPLTLVGVLAVAGAIAAHDETGPGPQEAAGHGAKLEGVEMAASDGSAEAIAGKWTVFEIAGGEVVEGAAPTLDFRGAQLIGHSGCNIFKTAVTQGGADLAFGPLDLRNEVCTPEIMQAETALIRALQRISRYEIAGEELLLYAFDDVMLRARR